MKVFDALWRVLRDLAFGLVAVVFFIEEWGWRPLTAFAARVARLPPVAWVEARIVALPPRVAMLLFLAPALLLFPLKLVALWLIEEGRASLGVSVIVAAKVLGTALVGRLFILLEPQLMQFAWFVRALGWWRQTKARVNAALRASPLWRRVRIMRRAWRLWLRRVAP